MLRLGYHPATYILQEIAADDALQDISATGWDGFEWTPGTLREHFGDAASLKRRLAGLDLQVSGLYCPCGFLNDEEVRRWQERIGVAIGFAKQIGTQFILIDGGSLELPNSPATIEYIAGLSNAEGRRIHEAGLTCTWHQHWDTLFQYQAEFDALMAATDPESVRCTPDTAQMALGGFDIPAAFEKHLDRISYVHFKDLDSNRRFVELGRGNVDFHTLANMLKEAAFDGWIVVDLDYTSLEPEESSRINLSYLQSTLGLAGRRRC